VSVGSRNRLLAAVDESREACANALRSIDPRQVGRPSLTSARFVAAFASGAEASVHVFEEQRATSDEARARLVQTTLLQTALQSLDRLDHAPLALAVKTRLCALFRRFCDPANAADRRFRPDLYDESRSLAACARLARFPAGQLDWDVSGLPRSYLWKVPRRDLPRLLRTVAFELRGFRPCFTPHMGVGRYPLLFLEAESHRSYYRMAESMALQPRVKGLVMAAWYHSRETIRVSPHLGWTNDTPLRHGAFVTDIGPASTESGFLEGSDGRRRLYECGAYRPTLGLVIWPRRDLLAWAAAHPEYGAESETD
jgi:hypothetical protein